jgi:flagellar biosynthetic protein FlhB
MAPSMLRTCVEMVRFFLLRAVELDPVKDRMIFAIVLRYLARLTLPVLAAGVVSGLFSNIVQTGFLYTTKPLVPDFTKIIPRFGQYFGRIFSVEGLFNLFKAIVKMAIIGTVAYVLIKSDIEKLANLQKANLWLSVTTVGSLAAKMLIISAVLLLVLSIPDYMFQRSRFRRRNQMSRQELKEEHKQMEGDPMVKNRLRSRMRELLTKDMLRNVPNADVVVTNPTHYAIALEYHAERMEAPMVIAKGEDEIAMRIRRVADQHGVPRIENRFLARTLYATTEIGDLVPPAYLRVIADIYVKVMKINEERRRAKGA